IVRLSREAAELYEAEERRLRLLGESAEAIGECFAAHVAKHTGTLARTALAFHAVSDELLDDAGVPRHPCSTNVSGNTMRLAIRFMGRAYQHAHVIYGECLGTNSPLELAKAMAHSLLAAEMETFNRREI